MTRFTSRFSFLRRLERQGAGMILLPLSVIVFFLIVGFVFLNNEERQRTHEQEVIREITAVEKFFLYAVADDAREIRAAFRTILQDIRIRDAYIARDRERLLQLSRPIFDELLHFHDITHFYFIQPDKTAWLRVHQPKRQGDVIDRITMRQAERTQEGSEGIELGPLGTFTLRVVIPWYVGEQLIGYLELGKEIDRILDALPEVLGVDFVVLIHKQYLTREHWEQGSHMLGQNEEWDRFSDAVIAARSLDHVPESLDRMIRVGQNVERKPIWIKDSRHDLIVAFIPLRDAADVEVGEFVLFRDVTALTTEYNNSTLFFMALAVPLSLVVAFLQVMIFLALRWRVTRITRHAAAVKRHAIRSNTVIRARRRDQQLIATIMEISLTPLPLHDKLKRSLEIILAVEGLAVGAQGAIYLNKGENEKPTLAVQAGDDPNWIDASASCADTPDNRFPGRFCMPIGSEDEALGVLEIEVLERFRKESDTHQFVATSAHALANMIRQEQTESGLAEMRKREHALRSMVENVGDCLFILDKNGAIFGFNRAAVRAFGYSGEELPGLNILDLTGQEELTFFTSLWNSVKSEGLTTMELGFLRKDGTTVIMDSRLSLFPYGADSLLIVTARDITERKLVEQQVEYSATHDFLTDLPNRALFLDRLRVAVEHARQYGTRIAVFFVDLDGFKEINDKMGHRLGDTLLQQVGLRLKATVRGGDTVGRYGGDEFTMLLTGDTPNSAVIRVAEEILETLSRPFDLGVETVTLSASIGIAGFPKHADDPVTLLHLADIAMYKAKRSGGHQYREALREEPTQ